MKTSIAFLFYCLYVFNVFANQMDFTGTEERPVPLIGIYQQIPYILFFNNDGTFKVTNDGVVVMTGKWIDNDDSVSFRPYGFANKVFISKDGTTLVCLQGVFYQGSREWRNKADIFCPLLEGK